MHGARVSTAHRRVQTPSLLVLGQVPALPRSGFRVDRVRATMEPGPAHLPRRYISPRLETQLGLRDTCGVHNLHGLPGILGGVVAALTLVVAPPAQRAAVASWALGNSRVPAGSPGCQPAASHCWGHLRGQAGGSRGWHDGT